MSLQQAEATEAVEEVELDQASDEATVETTEPAVEEPAVEEPVVEEPVAADPAPELPIADEDAPVDF